MSHRARSEVHIASFVVQHRDDAYAALQQAIDAHPELDMAIRDQTRSVVICESEDSHALMDRIDMLRAVPGVLNVLLVYHHAEPREDLEALVEATHGSGDFP